MTRLSGAKPIKPTVECWCRWWWCWLPVDIYFWESDLGDRFTSGPGDVVMLSNKQVHSANFVPFPSIRYLTSTRPVLTKLRCSEWCDNSSSSGTEPKFGSLFHHEFGPDCEMLQTSRRPISTERWTRTRRTFAPDTGKAKWSSLYVIHIARTWHRISISAWTCVGAVVVCNGRANASSIQILHSEP